MPIRDDSAGSYGTWNNDDLSWIDWLGAKASDGGNALSNLGRNLVDGFSPVGTSEQGNMALQVPPVLSGIAQSYGRLAGSPSHPGSAYNLSGVPELDAPIQQDMSNVLLSLYGGNAVAGLTKPKGALGAGASVKTALPYGEELFPGSLESRKPISLHGGPTSEMLQPEYSAPAMLAMRPIAEAQLVNDLFKNFKSNARYSKDIDGSYNPLDAAREAFLDYRLDRNEMVDSWRKTYGESKAGGKMPFHYDMLDEQGNNLGVAHGTVAGDTMHFDWLGGHAEDANRLGVKGVRALREQVRADFPNVKNFEGFRVSGARAGKGNPIQSVSMLSDHLPSPLGSALATGGDQDLPPWLRF